MTLMPVHTVPRLYGDRTLAVIEDLIGGGPLDQASDAIASQTLDPEVWRSMNKGSLEMVGSPDADEYRAFARALAYDDTLPSVVMSRVQKLRRASRACGRCEVVYFPDAIGLLHLGDVTHGETDLRRMVNSTMCLITRDIRPEDFVRRHAPFERTMWRWLDHLRSASVCCDGLKLPRADHLLRAA
ncbi:hypothetical protein [Thalassococcus profundi]|uniref:hypothetical protein n=1 Tax=Thalassococcus profundi TaxID=2282382 RepID=UPI004059D445